MSVSLRILPMCVVWSSHMGTGHTELLEGDQGSTASPYVPVLFTVRAYKFHHSKLRYLTLCTTKSPFTFFCLKRSEPAHDHFVLSNTIIC